MEVATTLDRDILGCKCSVFARDLTHLTTAILNRKNKKSQMKLFQDFKRQFFWRNRRLIYGDVRVERCSAKMRSMLLVRAEELNRFGMELSTVLLDLVASINSENCGQNCSSFMGGIYRSMPHECEAEFRVIAAFRGKPEFMKLLFNFGLLCSLPEGSPLVREAAEEMMGNFM